MWRGAGGAWSRAGLAVSADSTPLGTASALAAEGSAAGPAVTAAAKAAAELLSCGEGKKGRGGVGSVARVRGTFYSREVMVKETERRDRREERGINGERGERREERGARREERGAGSEERGERLVKRGERRGERRPKAGGSERTSFSLSCFAAATSCSRCTSIAARSCSACATACPAWIASSSAFARFFRACRVVGNSRTEPHPHVPKQAKPRYKCVDVVLGACGENVGVTRTLSKRRAMQRLQTYSRRSASAAGPTDFAGARRGKAHQMRAGGAKSTDRRTWSTCDTPLNQPGNPWVPSQVQNRKEDATVMK